MPLARIITRSPECWRELALDLLARKYAVEIVSPDAIPDNFADLELRVETDSVNDLTANIAVRGGKRSTSLDFVHYLRAPMEDFLRRPPTMDRAATAAPRPSIANAGKNQPQEIELPTANSSQDLVPVPAVFELPPNFGGGTRREALPQQIPLPAEQASPRSGITIIFHRSQSKTKGKPRALKRSSGWLLRTSAGFALVAVLGGVLATGIRRGESPVESAPPDSHKVAPVETAGFIAAPVSLPVNAAVAGSPSASSQTASKEASKTSASPAASSSQLKRQRESSLGEVKDLTSGEATVFRDKPAARNTSRRKSRHQYHGDKIAPDTVTYLDRRFAPRSNPRN